MNKSAALKHPPPSAPVMDVKYVVELPVNDSSGGFAFSGVPPVVSAVLLNFPELKGHDVAGCYVTAVQLPGVEIAGFSDTRTLERVLQMHQHVPCRRLVLSTHPPTYYSNQGLLYRHDLPEDADLGIAFSSFPPKVSAVDKLSPFSGRILAGQFVDSIVVPGFAGLDIHSGGFTGHRVTQYLRETATVPGRQIVIKDHPDNPTARAGFTKIDQSDPFDLGGFAISNWFRWPRTMLSKKK